MSPPKYHELSNGSSWKSGALVGLSSSFVCALGFWVREYEGLVYVCICTCVPMDAQGGWQVSHFVIPCLGLSLHLKLSVLTRLVDNKLLESHYLYPSCWGRRQTLPYLPLFKRKKSCRGFELKSSCLPASALTHWANPPAPFKVSLYKLHCFFQTSPKTKAGRSFIPHYPLHRWGRWGLGIKDGRVFLESCWNVCASFQPIDLSTLKLSLKLYKPRETHVIPNAD